MKLNTLNKTAPMGMGCWSIGGPFFSGDNPLGFADVNDRESIATIDAALESGIRLFDTAAVYGAGHSERLLGKTLKHRDDVSIVTKLGMPFDEQSKQVLDIPFTASDVMPSIDASRSRLQRDTIDVILLHQNAATVEEATPLFEQMEHARQLGKVKAYGWSTDFPKSVAAIAAQPGFTCVEHAMNLFFDAPTIQTTIEQLKLTALIRSPLAMGILSGKFNPDTVIASHDHRSLDSEWHDYFHQGKVNTQYLSYIQTIKELLCSGNRTLAQGSIGWLWAKSGNNVPIPGARTVDQIRENSAAISKGPLEPAIMSEIETIIKRPPEGVPRAR